MPTIKIVNDEDIGDQPRGTVYVVDRLDDVVITPMTDECRAETGVYYGVKYRRSVDRGGDSLGLMTGQTLYVMNDAGRTVERITT